MYENSYLLLLFIPLHRVPSAAVRIHPSTHISAPHLPNVPVTLWARLHFPLVIRALFFPSPSSDEERPLTPLFLQSSHSYSVAQSFCLSLYLYHLFQHMPYYWILKTEAVLSSEKSVNVYQTIVLLAVTAMRTNRRCVVNCTRRVTRNTAVMTSSLNTSVGSTAVEGGKIVYLRSFFSIRMHKKCETFL
jgi:hypothetical protein